ncbi:protein FAM83F [Pelodytes ibericus]
MADSQLVCLRDDNVNERVTEDMAKFYYSEDHRRSLEVLVNHGVQQYRQHIKEASLRDFLSSKELIEFRDSCTAYEVENSPKKTKQVTKKQDKDTKSSLEYWPQLSDTEIPPLDLGWPQNGYYRGVSQMLVYTHPPKENAPTIKAIVREMIQKARKVIAIVMDLFTDREVFKDILDAAEKRRVPVYILLAEGGTKYFLEMCEQMPLSSFNLRNLRVRYVTGVGFYLPCGKINGSLSHKYVMVDGDKVAFGSFRLTWSSFRVDRSIMTLLSGQYTEPFDIEFRELYAISEEINLYKLLSIPDSRPSQLMESRPRSSTVARKLINPKYSLVVGRSLAPGEMLRFGTPNPPAAGEDGESEGERRMATFLEDLVTIEQDLPEIVKLEDLPKVAISATAKKKEPVKAIDGTGPTKPMKRFSKFFGSKRQQNPSPDTIVEGGFVVIPKQRPDPNHNLRSQSHQDLRNSGNISPVSRRSVKQKQQDKCIIS